MNCDQINNKMLANSLTIIYRLLKLRNSKIETLKNELETLKLTNQETEFDRLNSMIVELKLENERLMKDANKIKDDYLCKQMIADDITIDIDYFKRKLKDVDWLLSGDNAPYTQEKLKSRKNVIIGEYYFNNMIAKNLSEYKCNKIKN